MSGTIWEYEIHRNGIKSNDVIGVAVFRDSELLYLASEYDFRDRNFDGHVSLWERSSAPHGVGEGQFVGSFIRQIWGDAFEQASSTDSRVVDYVIANGQNFSQILFGAGTHAISSAATWAAKKAAISVLVSVTGGPVIKNILGSIGVDGVPQWIFTQVGKKLLETAASEVSDALIGKGDEALVAGYTVRYVQPRDSDVPDFTFGAQDADRTHFISFWGSASIVGTSGNDRVTAPAGGDLIDLSAGGDNYIDARQESYARGTILAGAGNDTIRVGSANPGGIDAVLHVDGGSGTDLLIVEASNLREGKWFSGRATANIEHRFSDGVLLTAHSSFEDIANGIASGGIHYVSSAVYYYIRPYHSWIAAQNIDLYEYHGDDGTNLFLSWNDNMTHAIGGAGFDTLYADWSSTTASIVWDLAADHDEEKVLGNGVVVRGIDRLLVRLGDGDNEVATASANNVIFGGAGDDVIVARHGNDLIDLSAGGDNEVLLGFSVGTASTLRGGSGYDRLTLELDAARGDRFQFEYGGTRIEANATREQIEAFLAHDEADRAIVTWSPVDRVARKLTLSDIEEVNLIGGNNNDLMIGLGGDETFRGGLGNDVVFGNGGHNTIIGTLAELNGDTILDLTWRDVIVAEGIELLDHNVVFDVERTRLVISPDGEVASFHINLRGEFLPDAFAVSGQEGVTEIRYLGGRPFDLSDVSDVVLEAVQDGPLVSGVLFPDGNPASLSVTAVNGEALDGVVELAGILGLLRISADGAFEYDPNAAQRLAEGVVEGDVFVATVMDEEDRSTEVTIEINVTGINDPASISGDTNGAVTEDDPDRQQASGVLTITDPDAGEDRFREPEAGALQGTFGAFTFDSDTGAWSYRIDDATPAVMALDAGEEATETLTVTSLDGTDSATVRITVTGSGVREPEAAETVEVSGLVADRAGAELAGTTVTFRPDGGGNASQVTDAAGRFAFELPVGDTGRLQAERGHGPEDPGITTGSALQALRMAVGLNPSWGPAGPMDFIAADFNGDGQLTTADALAILRVAVGLAAANAPRWVFVDEGADFSGLNRGATQIETGVRVDTLAADVSDLVMVGILVGDVREYG